MPVLLVLCSEILFLCQWVQGYFPHSHLSDSVFMVLWCCPWSILRWVLCMVISKDLFGFSYKISTLTNTIFWRCCLFSSVYFWLLYKKSGSHRCVNYVLVLILFHWPICLFLCQYHGVFNYYSSIVQGKIRDGETASSSFIFQDCFSYSRFLFLYTKLRIFNFQDLWRTMWEFWWGFIESVGCFW